MDEVKDLNYYKLHTLMGDGDLLENEWFKNNKKDYYSISDILKYAYWRNPSLKESIDDDESIIETIKRQIRRVMKKNFDLSKSNKSFSYKLDEAETKFLVNTLLKDYWDTFVIPGVKSRQLLEVSEKFWKARGIDLEDLLERKV